MKALDGVMENEQQAIDLNFRVVCIKLTCVLINGIRIQDQMVFSNSSHAQMVCWSSNKECWGKYLTVILIYLESKLKVKISCQLIFKCLKVSFQIRDAAY